MPTIDLTDYLKDTDFTLEGIVSTKFPAGKAYRFPSPTAARGLWMRDLVKAANIVQLTGEPDPELTKLVLDDAQEMDLYREVMGGTLDELLADGVSWAAVQRIFGLLFRYYGADRDISTQLREAVTPPITPGGKVVAKMARKAAGPTLPMKRPAKKAPAKKTPGRPSTAVGS